RGCRALRRRAAGFLRARAAAAVRGGRARGRAVGAGLLRAGASRRRRAAGAAGARLRRARSDDATAGGVIRANRGGVGAGLLVARAVDRRALSDRGAGLTGGVVAGATVGR